LALADEEDVDTLDLSDSVISLPHVNPFFSPIMNTIVLQWLAYFNSEERMCPIDFPRNLAKVVTGE
jgi:glutamine---fructose-6-phosphate transaminase (isomerizing)